jgi:cytochrome d ubiquinol oxidase subunit I
MDGLTTHRIQFAITIIYHYLFPQLTMGLALLIVVLKSIALWRGDRVANEAARFWTRIFGLSFVMGVVTGIPMEFQFGTNWARFSEASGSVIAQTLTMESVFSFFLESTFLYLLLYQEERLGPRAHWAAAVAVFLGSWLSGFFIVCTNAFMQHPVGHRVAAAGMIELNSLAVFLTNPWALAQYAHTMVGAVITGSFALTAVGAYYRLQDLHTEHADTFLRVGVVVGLAASLAAAFPTGDRQARLVSTHQPVTFAAMEGHFESTTGAGLVIIGQPDMERLTLDNPIVIPRVLSFLTHYRWSSFIPGLQSYPRDQWPDNVPLLYYAYHMMAGLGTMFIAVMGVAAALLHRGRLFAARWMLWILMFALPFPYIANTAGWMTAELGRQPWLVHGIMRTALGTSDNVSSGNVLFTLLGFLGLYAMLSVLFLFLAARLIARGPGGEVGA